MKDWIQINEIIDKLSCVVINKSDKINIKWVVASGLMSDVLTTEHDEILLVSNLTTSQIVRTADMVDANAILICNGKKLAIDTIELAKELNITVLVTKYPIFESCYILGKLFYEE